MQSETRGAFEYHKCCGEAGHAAAAIAENTLEQTASNARRRRPKTEGHSLGGAQKMRTVAIKKGQSREKAAGLQEMGTVRCEGCGEEFSINHHPAFVDKRLAEKQAHWLEK